MAINIIFAVSQNNVIGKKNKMPWYLPEDLKRFKELTTDGVVIMGRNTWHSIPASHRPLPDRLNIVLSKSLHLSPFHDNVPVYNSLHKAIADYMDKEIWIIGGLGILKEALPIASAVYLTKVHTYVEEDTLDIVHGPRINLLDYIVEAEPVVTSVTGLKYQNLVLKTF